MALTRRFPSNHSNQVRQNAAGSKQGAGDDIHAITGSTGSGSSEYTYRSLVNFAQNYTGMARVVKIELAIQTEVSSTHFSVAAAPKTQVMRLTQSFPDGTHGENSWSSSDYAWPASAGPATPVIFASPINPATGKVQDDAWVFVDITDLMQPVAYKGVPFANGKVGGGVPFFGLMLRAPGTAAAEKSDTNRMIFHAFDQSGSGSDPYLLVTYDPVNSAPTAPTLTGPATTNNSFGDSFEGDHHDPDLDPMNARQIEVWPAAQVFPPAAGAKPTWSLDPTLQTATSEESQTGHFSVPLSLATGQLKLATAYVWRARTQDLGGLWGAFSPPRGLTITSSAPTVVATALAPLPSMSGAVFGGTYTDPDHNPLAQFQLQMQPAAAHNDAAFVDQTVLVWDTGPTFPTTDEITAGVISRAYGGSPLGAGNYTYRIKVQDSTGTWSGWSYADFSLAADFDPDPGNVVLTTQIARNPPSRIALYSMGPNRGPGNLIGYVDDPTNLGASRYLNGAGEVYFSLPALHPYCPSIEPLQTHYAVEQYFGDRYVTRFAGLINDFDADTDTVTFYGADYLGLLMTAVDERYNPANERAVPPAGSYYSNLTIDSIIRDQLTYHKGLPDSPVGFVTVPATGPSFSAISERATIYATYAEALPFISGLINSHKQGTGREARFYDRPSAAAAKTTLAAAAAAGAVNVKVVSVASWAVGDTMVLGPNDVVKVTAVGTAGAAGTGITFTGMPLKWAYPVGSAVVERLWEWALVDNWGKDRPNIVLEWGGLLNDFRVVALGDFGTRVLAVGQKRGEVKVYRAVGLGGLVESQWGRRAKTAFFPDIIDQNDLQRRANENASQLSKIGKRMALALQADALVPFDGWDIGDNVVINIERGVVDTSQYGSGGFWTIYGIEWRYNPDGHTDLTLTVLPKKSATPPDPDLIPSVNPGVPLDWQVGHGVPISYGAPPAPTPPPTSLRATVQGDEVTTFSLPLDTDPALAAHYQDLNSGCVYELDQDWSSPTYNTYVEVYCPATGTGGGGAPPDTTPPDVPVVRVPVGTSSTTQTDGTSITNIIAEVGFATAPVGLVDLDQISLQATRYALPSDATQPDWTLATQWLTPSIDRTGAADTSVIVPAVLSATKYWLRASAVDQFGNRSGWSPVVTVVTAVDTAGPPQPSNVVLTPGNTNFGIHWDPIEVADLAYVEVQYGLHPATAWTSVRVAGTVAVVTGLANGVQLDVRVRSVDTSGNTLNGDGTTSTIDDDTAGWVVVGSVTPVSNPVDPAVWTDTVIASIFAGKINADWIDAGTLKIGVGAGNAAGITVYDSAGHLVGRWTPAGIEVFDPANPDYKMVITAAGLTIYTGMAAVPPAPLAVVSMGPLGIDAASITFGSARGGHNLIANSSFELGKFATGGLANLPPWDLAADFNASRVGADTNLTQSASTLTMTVV